MNTNSTQEVNEYIASNETDIKIRRGKRSDCKEVARLIQELADFEKMPNGPEISEQMLEADGFIRNPPLFHLFVAERPGTEGKPGDALVAYALYYNKYSSWKGKAMILEDLYCTPEFRGQHIGSALFKAVVGEAVSQGCRQLDFEVLGWNPATKFYEKLGATNVTEKESWQLFRMSKEDLQRLKV